MSYMDACPATRSGHPKRIRRPQWGRHYVVRLAEPCRRLWAVAAVTVRALAALPGHPRRVATSFRGRASHRKTVLHYRIAFARSSLSIRCMPVQRDDPSELPETKASRLGLFDNWVARVAAVAGALAIVIPGGLAAKNYIFAPEDWRTEADKVCLAYLDGVHDALTSGWDEKRRFDLWPSKLDDLWQIDVPVDHELVWREYLNSDGDLETVVADSWNEERNTFDEGRWSYGFGASQESFDRIQKNTKKLGLSVCGTEMEDTPEWVGLRFAINRRPAPEG